MIEIKTRTGAVLMSLETESLQGADLQGEDLRGADFQGANLRGADLRWANLHRADLRGADLRGAHLQWASLQRSHLQEVDLRGANLWQTNFQGADLWQANLRGSDLRGSNLREANLREADLRGADLRGADVTELQLSPFRITPEGDLVGWKRCGLFIVQLRIPAEAKRMSTPIDRQCRAEFADVLSIEKDGKSCDEPARSSRGLVYEVGRRAIPDRYDDDWRTACSNGIHFFLTKREAEGWG